MKKIVALVMCAVMCCLMLTSCGDSKYVGTWKSEIADVATMTITLEKDHTAKLAYGDIESGDDDKGEWEVKDKKIIIKDPSGKDSDKLEFTIVDDKTISLSEGGVSINFKKQ
jgi:hypothetical protein